MEAFDGIPNMPADSDRGAAHVSEQSVKRLVESNLLSDSAELIGSIGKYRAAFLKVQDGHEEYREKIEEAAEEILAALEKRGYRLSQEEGETTQDFVVAYVKKYGRSY